MSKPGNSLQTYLLLPSGITLTNHHVFRVLKSSSGLKFFQNSSAYFESSEAGWYMNLYAKSYTGVKAVLLSSVLKWISE